MRDVLHHHQHAFTLTLRKTTECHAFCHFSPDFILNDSIKMNGNKYSDNELHLMSYQELRRLSILLRLPANIKKKHMISMIQAHQKGDGCTKTAIANQIMEERKVKRMGTKGKHAKSFMMASANTTQQIPTDLSLSTKHEFETRFSYVAHYTSKENTNAGISRIIKQEAEVSRRNRSILHQTRKPTRKLSTVGRTEIMLPRNHSLTTPVRLMPQYERGFAPPNQYDNIPGLPNAKNHFQDASSYNYHFHGDYSNSLMPPSSHELYRNEPYWHTREVYNNSLMPILSSLLTPNSVTINSSGYASQYSSQNAMKSSSSFQGVYEKYIRSGDLVESQDYETNMNNSSTVIMNDHFPEDDNNDKNNNNGNSNNTSGYVVTHGSYIVTKGDVDFEIKSALNEISCQQYNRRDDTVIRHSGSGQSCLVDFYLPRNGESIASSQVDEHIPNDSTHYTGEYLREESKRMSPLAIPHEAFEEPSAQVQEGSDMVEGDVIDRDQPEPHLSGLNDYESGYVEDGKFWDESIHGSRSGEDKSKTEKDGFMEGFLKTPTHGGFLTSEMSESSTELSVNTEQCLAKNDKEESQNCSPVILSRCRYILGHNNYPEVVNRSDEASAVLPSFLSTFCTSRFYNKAYSMCRNSFTGTTEIHANPIMTSTYASQFVSHSNSEQNHNNQNSSGSSQIPRQWLYSYGESQAPFSMESTTYSTWDEYTDDMGNKVITHNNGHEVQVVKCRKHGCHYLYSISNPCD